MPRKKGGVSSSPEHGSSRFYLRSDTRRQLKHRSADEDRSMSEIVQDALDLTLAGGLARLPLLGGAAAGSGALVREEAGKYITVPQQITFGATFALTVEGDSMAPGIVDGDIVLVRRQPDAQNGQIVVAVFDDEDHPSGPEGVVKRLRQQFGEKELRSDNEEWGVIRSNFEIKGIVVALFRRME